MGMIFTAVQVSEEQIREPLAASQRRTGLFRKRPVEPSADFWFEAVEAAGDEETVDLDKAWHGIHWLLTSGTEDSTTPEGQAVLGATPVCSDPEVRLIDPAGVRRVAAALTALSPAELAGRVDLAAMDRAGLYPQIWDEEDVFDTYLAPYYAGLRDFYRTAAERDSAVLLSIG